MAASWGQINLNTLTGAGANLLTAFRALTRGGIVEAANVMLEPEGWRYVAGASGIVSSTTAVTFVAAGGSNTTHHLKTLCIDHDTLSAVTEFVIRSGAGGTVIHRGKLQTTAKEGTVLTFSPPLAAADNTLLEFALLSSVTGGVYVNATGHTRPTA